MVVLFLDSCPNPHLSQWANFPDPDGTMATPWHTNRWQANFMGSSHLIPGSRWLVPPMLSLDIFLVGGFFPILKNHGVRNYGKDDIPYYDMENIQHVWNHQPALVNHPGFGVSRIGGRDLPTWCRCGFGIHTVKPWKLLPIDWFRGTFTWNHGYPPVNQHNYEKSPFFMGKLTINDAFP